MRHFKVEYIDEEEDEEDRTKCTCLVIDRIELTERNIRELNFSGGDTPGTYYIMVDLSKDKELNGRIVREKISTFLNAGYKVVEFV